MEADDVILDSAALPHPAGVELHFQGEVLRMTPPDELPYGDVPGQTHWDGCWRARGHHNCAVREIERLRAAPREPGGDLIRRADVLAAIREASVHYEAGHESWLVSPHRLSETIQVLSAPRPDAGDGTGEP